jgi:23S rRNA (cytidine1920-2'-O)/16S rRNA (cytidine1409-2'-O)-methyltransferase
MARRRADTLLAERGLAPSRSAAAASVRAGRVRLGAEGREVEKPSELLPEDAELVVSEGKEFVSRGGIKLHNALTELGVEVDRRRCLDVGASMGGFTDCLLQATGSSTGGCAKTRVYWSWSASTHVTLATRTCRTGPR